MANISLLSGKMLQADLKRGGINLAVETDLLYLDVVNNRIGINNNAPAVGFDLDVTGHIRSTNLTVTGTGTIGNVVTAVSTINSTVGDLVLTAVGNISVDNNKIISCLDPTNNLDVVNLQTLNSSLVGFSPDRIVSGDSLVAVLDAVPTSADELVFDVNYEITALGTGVNWNAMGATASPTVGEIFTYNGTAYSGTTVGTAKASDPAQFKFILDTGNAVLTINALTFTTTAQINAPDANIADLNITNNVIKSNTASPVSIDVSSDFKILQYPLGDRALFTDTSGNVRTNAKFLFVGSTGDMTVTGSITVDDLTLDADGITSNTAGMNLTTTANGDLLITTGTGVINTSSTAAIQLPSGITTEQPTGVAGMVRWNTTKTSAEIFDGTNWNATQVGFSVTSQRIIPDGITAIFTLNKSATADGILVIMNGIVQDPDLTLGAYTVSGTTLTMASVPLTSDIISIRFLEV